MRYTDTIEGGKINEAGVGFWLLIAKKLYKLRCEKKAESDFTACFLIRDSIP